MDLEGPLEVNGDGLELHAEPVGQVEQAQRWGNQDLRQGGAVLRSLDGVDLPTWPESWVDSSFDEQGGYVHNH